MKHLFSEWDKVKEKVRGRRVYLFLDYDGVLAPLASTPEKPFIPKEVKALLRRLSEKPEYRIAVISGREIKYIMKKVGLKGIVYSGNHGLQIEGPKIKFEAPVSRRYRTDLGEIKERLEKGLSSVKGAFVEYKNLSLSLHYRLVGRRDISHVKAVFGKTVRPYLAKKRVKVNTGKMLLEVRPPSAWDKGRAVLRLLAKERAGRTVPIYIGDDETDEDAFRVLKDKGITVFVGKPKPSYARYYLKDTDEVKEFLKRLYAGRDKGKRAV